MPQLDTSRNYVYMSLTRWLEVKAETRLRRVGYKLHCKQQKIPYLFCGYVYDLLLYRISHEELLWFVSYFYQSMDCRNMFEVRIKNKYCINWSYIIFEKLIPYIVFRILKILNSIVLVSLSPHNLAQLPCCFHSLWEIKKYIWDII
jgi:hypothetical protein